MFLIKNSDLESKISDLESNLEPRSLVHLEIYVLVLEFGDRIRIQDP